MDWYSWLSNTNLDRAWVYEYSLTFLRSDLKEHDITSFDHEFLQRLGISRAKHRLEILKLSGSGKEVKGRMSGFSKLALVMKKTKKLFGRLSFNREEKQRNHNKALFTTRRSRTWSWSGPLGTKMEEDKGNAMVYPNQSPLVGYISRSPTVPRLAENKCWGDADWAETEPVWSLMFRDMKPT